MKKFALERWVEGRWEAFASGTAIGESLELGFPPVTAQRVRLNLLECAEGPSIWEFQLFP